MRTSTFLSLLLAVPFALAVSKKPKVPKPDADGKYTLEAPGIRAQFIPFAAAITNLFVKDKNGIERDIVLGHDTAAEYPPDGGSHLGAVPGRYANRLGDATYVLKGKRYYLERNDGNNTLHSGSNGWGRREWKTLEVTKNSITFAIHDPDNSTGFPGAVDGTVKYTLKPGQWDIEMTAKSLDTLTPLLLTQHTYFQLDGYANPETDLILNHTYWLPQSRRILDNRPDQVPTGRILTPAKGSVNDFSTPKQLGADSGSPEWVDNCGKGCNGYNNFWIVDRSARAQKNWQSGLPAFMLKSDWSGIKVQAWTNQAGVQLYTCWWSDGTAKIKKTQGGEGAKTDGFVKSSGCVAIEAQDWNDGINHPEWKRKQLYGPGETYKWLASYKFSAEGKYKD